MPLPTCFSYFLMDSSPLDSKRLDSFVFILSSPVPHTHAPCAPTFLLCGHDATIPAALILCVHLKDLEHSQNMVYLNYMAVEYNVSFPHATRE